LRRRCAAWQADAVSFYEGEIALGEHALDFVGELGALFFVEAKGAGKVEDGAGPVTRLTKEFKNTFSKFHAFYRGGKT
jgi:hypothetical protein